MSMCLKWEMSWLPFCAPEIIYSAYKLASNSGCFNDEINYLPCGFGSCRKSGKNKSDSEIRMSHCACCVD